MPAARSTIQIVDDVIGAFFLVDGPGLLIWNWRTGKNVVVGSYLRSPLILFAHSAIVLHWVRPSHRHL